MSDKGRLQQVISHLKELSQKVSAPNVDVSTRRRIIDSYFAADPQIMKQAIFPKKVEVKGMTGYWFVPEDHDGKKRMLYIHGGSWMSGSVLGWGAFVGQIAQKTDCAILFIEYALMPEQPFPAGLNDCLAAYEWLLSEGPYEKAAPDKVFMAGDSAGGNLTLACLLALKDKEIPMPDGVLAISPCTDLTASGDSMVKCKNSDPIINPDVITPLGEAYVQGAYELTNPLVSPLFADLSGLPPLMIQTGEAEVLLDDSLRFAKKAQEAGVKVLLDTWPNMPHVFQGFSPFLPQAREAMDNIGNFFRDIS